MVIILAEHLLACLLHARFFSSLTAEGGKSRDGGEGEVKRTWTGSREGKSEREEGSGRLISAGGREGGLHDKEAREKK